MEFSNKFVTTDNQINEDYEGRVKCPLCSKTFSQKYLGKIGVFKTRFYLSGSGLDACSREDLDVKLCLDKDN